MKKFIITIALFFIMTTSALAAELIMFSTATCVYCQKFLKEVAPTYAEQEFAKLLPLRIISMDMGKAPDWYDEAYNDQRIDGIAGTPTFVVFANGEERARLIGYNGKERFYEDMTNFINDNRSKLEATAGQNPIPYEKDTEMNYKEAQINRGNGDKQIKDEGSHSKSVPEQQHPTVPFLAPNWGANPKEDKKASPHDGDLLPNGVINSRDIMDHIYKTEKEAQIAAMWLGCRGVHSHNLPDKGLIWMPCEMQ